jgi:hypothetical protein
MMDFKS